MGFFDALADFAPGLTAIGGVASAAAGILGANAQEDAAARAAGLTQAQLDQIRADNEPFRAAGLSALERLLAENIGPLEETPDFRFARDQGEEAINRSLGARGKRFSGQAARAAGGFATDLARRFAGDRRQTLGSIAGFGPGATSANTAAGISTGGQLANLALQSGNATASSFAAPANAFNATLNDLVSQAALRGAFE